jgi:hypothetical protein
LWNFQLANQAFCCAVFYEAPWNDEHRVKMQEQIWCFSIRGGF